MTGRRTLRTGLLAVGLLAGAAGVSYGTTALTTSTTVIQACQAKNGVLRVVVSAAECDQKFETTLSWNSDGPAGTPGPAGAAGPAGPVGHRRERPSGPEG
jgi:hypothetical protein